MSKIIALWILSILSFGSIVTIYSFIPNTPNTQKAISFIWEEDLQSIPHGGTPILLEDWDENNNTIYLRNCPVEPDYVISLLPNNTVEIFTGKRVIKCKFEDIQKELTTDNL